MFDRAGLLRSGNDRGAAYILNEINWDFQMSVSGDGIGWEKQETNSEFWWGNILESDFLEN